MKFKSTLILLLATLLAGGGLYYLIKVKKVPTSDEVTQREHRVLTLKAGDITGLEIQGVDRNFAFERKDGKWFLKRPLQVAANASEIEGVLSTLEFMEARRILTSADLREAKRSLSDYGLEKPRLVAHLATRNGEIVLHIGNEARQGDALYIQVAGNPAVFLVSKDLATRLDKKLDDYRERTLFDFTEAQVSRLEIRNGSKLVEFNKTNSVWRITQPLTSQAESSKVSDLLQQTTALRAIDFLSDDPTAAKEYGLEDATQEISMRLERNDAPYGLVIGNKLKTDDKKVAARVKGQNSIISIPSSFVAEMTSPLSDFRDHALAQFNPSEVNSVEVRTRQVSFTVQRSDDGWKIVEPEKIDADGEMVEQFLTKLNSVRIKEFVADVATDADKLGLKPAISGIVLKGKSLSSVASTNEVTFLDLSLGKDDPARKLTFAQIAGESSIYGLDSAEVAELPHNTMDLRSRVLFQIKKEALISIQEKHVKNTVTLEKDASGAWKVTEQPQAVPDPTATEMVVNQMERFAVQKIIGTALNPMVKQYGLENPFLTLLVTHQVDDNPVTEEILVGHENAQKKYFVLWKNQLLICEISPEQHQSLMRDLVKTKP